MKSFFVCCLIWSLQFIFAEETYVLHHYHLSSLGLELPEFLTIWTLNDRVILRYDSQALLSDDPPAPDWLNHRDGLLHWREMIFIAKVVHKYMKMTLKFAGEHGNLTGILHYARIYQTYGYCGLHPNGTISTAVSHGFNGKDFLTFDIAAKTWTTTVPQAVHYIRSRSAGAFDLERIFYYYNHECPERLRGILKFAHWIHNQTVPQVHIFKHRSLINSREILCCHVTGFYPKAVQVKWLRPDGLSLVDGVSSGEVLPNEDGSYQLRSSLQLPEEPQSSYSCVVLHSSVTGNITVTWGTESTLFP
ncbi:zinc-alpha-2-glycoprotein-like isoform X2 [Brachyhypopomus gauderio]|uniref:zinc-alpha-2-glycoprotein-like isoform X2 n=1 Tax=Brachyhypopomus gauderio TaxID=698409 RepID=UPI0040436821